MYDTEQFRVLLNSTSLLSELQEAFPPVCPAKSSHFIPDYPARFVCERVTVYVVGKSAQKK